MHKNGDREGLLPLSALDIRASIHLRGQPPASLTRESAPKHLPPEFRTRNISATARSRSGRIVKRRDVTNWLKELSGCGRLRTSPHSKAQLCKAFSIAFSRAYLTSCFELSTPRTEICRNSW